MNFFKEYWVGIVMVLLLTAFFGKIISNINYHGKKNTAFKISCEKAGGVYRIPKGVKGFPKPSCMNPDCFINLEKIE